MKNAVLQIKRFYDIEKNQYLKNFQVRNNKIKYSDGYINFEKQVNYDFNIDFEIDIKAAYDIMKNIKKVESAKVENDFLIINDFHKLPITEIEKIEEKTGEAGRGKLIVENLKLKDIKDFLNIETKNFKNVLSFVCFSKNEIALCDGNRLNVMEIKNNIEENQTFLINAELLKKLNNESINIYAYDKHIYITDSFESIKTNPELITINNEKYEYPNYKQLLPHHENKVEIKNIKEILAFLKSIKNYVNKRTNLIIFKDNKIFCDDDNYIPYNFDFKFFNFEELEHIGINYNYLVNLLNYMENDFILYYSGNLSPLYAVNGNKKTLLMPIQIRDEETETEENQNNTELETAENEIEKNKTVSETAEEPQNKTESEEMKNALNESIKNLENSEEYKSFIQKQKEEKPENVVISETEKRNDYAALTKENIKDYEKSLKHTNYVTGKEYNNKNIEILEKAMKQYNYVDSAWLGAYQAKKVKLQLKKENHPVTIQVYIPADGENEKPRYYLENVYNIADFEEMQKIEETSDFAELVNKLKTA